MNHPKEFRNKEVVILGLARSGRAAAMTFHNVGAKVTINDKKERHLSPEADELEALGISVICGHHPDNLIHAGVSLVVKNPGIPYTAAPIARAIALGIEVVTEIEVAYHLNGEHIIGITGSNGKTTTTTWIGQVIKAAGLPLLVAGNIGLPLCEAVAQGDSEQWKVVELSSFQLKGVDQFRPQVSCILNICETHLDYHGSMDDYVASKSKIFSNQTSKDTAVINWDDPTCRQFIPQIKASLMKFSMKESLDKGVYIVSKTENGEAAQDWIVYRGSDELEQFIIKVRDLGIPAKHNVENALAVVAIAISIGIDFAVLVQVLKDFRGVEHRLEYVHTLGSILFYNNSKATNSLATIKALDAFDEDIILIAGGLDRGADYEELEPWFRDKVKGLVLIGETKHKIKKIAERAGIQFIHTVDNDKNASASIKEAVKAAYALAQAGDVILLSPACASWDMFDSYEERGRMFKDSVHNL